MGVSIGLGDEDRGPQSVITSLLYCVDVSLHAHMSLTHDVPDSTRRPYGHRAEPLTTLPEHYIRG